MVESKNKTSTSGKNEVIIPPTVEKSVIQGTIAMAML